MRLLYFILLLIFGRDCYSQSIRVHDQSPHLKFPLKTTLEQEPIPLPKLNESEFMWTRRTWRKLDLREKMNHVYYFPVKKMSDRESLLQALLKGIEENKITAYEDDEFKTTKSSGQIKAELTTKDTTFIDDPDKPGQMKRVIIPNEFNPASVKQFRIKEDWFYDKHLNRMEFRILAIAAVQEVFASDGSLKGHKVLFWVYYPQARKILARTEAFNRHNDAARISFDDMFLRRFFSSFVYKELDVFEKTMTEYESGIEALLESEKIKEDILNYEVTLWEY